jgi:replicative DNA helicase
MKPTIPQNPEAETAALGCLLFGASPHAVPMTADHFAAPNYQLIFATICDLTERGHAVTVQAVTTELRAKGNLENAGGPGLITALYTAEGPIGGDSLLAFHFDHLETARQAREAFVYCTRHLPEVAAGRLPAPAFAEELAARCAPVAASAGHTAESIVREMDAEEARGEPPELFPTGLRPLDQHLAGGFHRGELGVIAGETGGGKSALMIQVAATVAEEGQRVLYLSLEMPRRDVLRRIAAAASGCPPHHEKFKSALCSAQVLPLTIHDDLSDLCEILAAIRGAARNPKAPAALVCVDYLQLIEAPGDTRELALSETARRLKSIALRESVAILTASQLNESGALRESRAIGHHADAVLFIGDEGITLGKFRRGQRNVTATCRLDGATSRFIQ